MIRLQNILFYLISYLIYHLQAQGTPPPAPFSPPPFDPTANCTGKDEQGRDCIGSNEEWEISFWTLVGLISAGVLVLAGLFAVGCYCYRERKHYNAGVHADEDIS